MKKQILRKYSVLFLSIAIVMSIFPSIASAASGELTGSMTKGSGYTNVDLTSLGDVDWAVWGYSSSGYSTSLSPDESMAGGSGISDLTNIDPDEDDALRGLGHFEINHTFNWSNGTNISSATGAYAGLQHNVNATYKTGDGFSFTVPADTAKRRLIVYTAVHLGIGELTATLSDGSAAQVTLDQNSKTAGNDPSRFIIDYFAGSDGQMLTINFVTTWNDNDGNGNVQIYAAALSDYHTATININKDGTPADAAGSVELRQNGSTVATATASSTGIYSALVLNGTYELYIDGTDTGKNIIINAADNSAALNYYTAAATTNAAADVSATGVTLNGTVNANNTSTTVTFEYGQTAAYGSSVNAVPGTVTGTSETSVSCALISLTPSTTYHYHVVAVNSVGTTNGADMTFTTSALPTAPIQTLNGTTVSFSSDGEGAAADHYEYRYSESEDWTEGGSADISGKAFPVTVYARAIDNVGNISEISTETYHSSQLTNLLLSTSASALSPAFDPKTLAYTTTVTNAAESISLKPVAKDATAAIVINGTAVSGSTFSGAIPLSVGDNIITVKVTAQDASSSTTYTLAVTRNAVLSEPTVNTYSGMYDGSAHTFSVESDTEGVQITYTTGTSEPVSTPPSFTEPGSYTISYTLTKEGYDDYTGSGTLEIQPSADATLSALHLSVNTADYAYTPEFASDTDVYAATVDYAVTEIELLPVTTDTQASYTINGTAVGDLSSATTVSLAEGKNEIPIEVTAQSGVDKKTYTLYVLRKEEAGGAAAPSNYYIAGGVFKGTAPYTISLMDGSTTVAETTSSSGEFVFEGLASGIYNLSIKDSSSPVKSMIVKQTITDQNITDAKYIFPTGDVNSSLEVSANTPKVRVGNLMEEALEHEVSGSQVDLTLNVSAEAAEEGTGQTAIEDQADGRTLLYLKITVDLTTVDLNTGETTETPLTSTNKVLEIIIPYDFSGKENIAVYRYHGSEVQEFTQLSALPESPVDLTCYLDTSNNYIYLYTSNFSEYAIGYDTIPVAASTDSDTSGTSLSATSSSTGSSTAAAEESTVTLIPLPLFKKDASPDTGDHAVPAGIVLTALILLLIVKFFLNGYETRIGLTDKRKSESIKKWAVWIKNGRNRERRLNVAVVCVGTHVLVCLIRKRIYNRMIVFRERTE